MSQTTESPNESSVIGEDCIISNLPDDIMSHILSSMPTICAVRTSVLSNEWKFKWASIYIIDICDDKSLGRPLHGEGETTFIQFMERIISQANNVKNVRLLLFKEYDLSVVKAWISALVLRNPIEDLQVATGFVNADHVIIPGGLLTSLRNIVLVGPVFSVPSMNCFTNLRSLRLERVQISNEESGNDTLVFNFRVLEAFQICHCIWSSVKIVEICAPALVTFIYERNGLFYNDATIKVQSGTLTEFTSKGGEPENITLTGAKVASAVFLNHFHEDEDEEPMQERGVNILRLLKEFSYTLEFLMLSFYATEVIMESTRLTQGVSLTSCANLKQLFLYHIDNINSGNTKVVLELLQAMPNLKCLYLDVTDWNDYDYEAVASLPLCITSSLEQIEFGGIVDNNTVAQLHLAKFFLKNALNLKEFRVYADGRGELAYEFFSKISAYPTGSRCVKVVGRNDDDI